MALKVTVDSLADVPAGLREHYAKASDGRFHLSFDGEPVKVTEFRNTNVALLKEVEELRPLKTKFDGIDPEVAKADRQKVLDLEKTNPDARLKVLEAELASEKAIRIETQRKADRSRVRDVLRVRATAAGVLPAAMDMLLDKAEPQFVMDGDVVKAKPNTFSPTRPGEPLSVDEWMTGALKDLGFLFGRSNGGGSDGRPGGGSGGDGKAVLRDPTPQQLGEHAKAIAAGEIRIVYSGGQ
jgi:hypothetical protein